MIFTNEKVIFMYWNWLTNVNYRIFSLINFNQCYDWYYCFITCHKDEYEIEELQSVFLLILRLRNNSKMWLAAGIHVYWQSAGYHRLPNYWHSLGSSCERCSETNSDTNQDPQVVTLVTQPLGKKVQTWWLRKGLIRENDWSL